MYLLETDDFEPCFIGVFSSLEKVKEYTDQRKGDEFKISSVVPDQANSEMILYNTKIGGEWVLYNPPSSRTSSAQYTAALKKLMARPAMTVVELAKKIGWEENRVRRYLGLDEVRPNGQAS